jgi:DNA ligase-associated metallophosphoesterase
MPTYLSHFIDDQHLVLSAERAVFWENENTLIIADLHVGKTGHFRKAGIGVPPQVYKEDLHRLLAQILFFKAERLIIVGDLTHSVQNSELELFRKWRKDFSTLDVQLVKGNHDILNERWYSDAEITINKDVLQSGCFAFVHDVFTKDLDFPEDSYLFSGHVHPGISMTGKGKQFLRFPCFYFAKDHCILPAFSKFTGTYPVQPKKGESVFAIMNQDLCKMPC